MLWMTLLRSYQKRRKRRCARNKCFPPSLCLLLCTLGFRWSETISWLAGTIPHQCGRPSEGWGSNTTIYSIHSVYKGVLYECLLFVLSSVLMTLSDDVTVVRQIILFRPSPLLWFSLAIWNVVIKQSWRYCPSCSREKLFWQVLRTIRTTKTAGSGEMYPKDCCAPSPHQRCWLQVILRKWQLCPWCEYTLPLGLFRVRLIISWQ